MIGCVARFLCGSEAESSAPQSGSHSGDQLVTLNQLCSQSVDASSASRDLLLLLQSLWQRRRTKICAGPGGVTHDLLLLQHTSSQHYVRQPVSKHSRLHSVSTSC